MAEATSFQFLFGQLRDAETSSGYYQGYSS